MRILYIVNSTRLREGSVRSFIPLILGMKDRGVDVVAVVPNKKGVYEILQKNGIRLYVLPVRLNIYPVFKAFKDVLLFLPRLLRRVLPNMLSYYKLKSIILNEKIDIIHTNVSVVNVGFKVAKKFGIPHVFHVREYVDKDFDLHYFPAKRSYKLQLLDAESYSICITKDIQRHHCLQGGENSIVIYDGIFHTNQVFLNSVKKPFFLYVGRFEPAKGLDSLIRAYNGYIRAIRKQPIPLFVIADNFNDHVYYLNVMHYIEDNNLSKHIRILGGRDDVVSFMRKALAIIIPSVFEGFGRCMTEAMFNGCLVIGHDTGGTKEQFDNGKELCGKEIGLRYDTEEQLTHRLIEVATHSPAYYEDMLRMAANTVDRLYSIEKHVDNVYGVYTAILSKKEEKSYIK